jgi:hypothetical protein
MDPNRKKIGGQTAKRETGAAAQGVKVPAKAKA